MLDIGWQELLVIGALALIVVGPKDLPGLLRSVGQWVGRVRGMARDFQRAMNDAAREADVADMKELRDLGADLRKSVDFNEQSSKAQDFVNKPASDDGKPDASAIDTSKGPDTDDPGAMAEPLDDAAPAAAAIAEKVAPQGETGPIAATTASPPETPKAG